MLKTCSIGLEVIHTRGKKKRRGLVCEIDARKLRARVRWLGLGKNLRTWVGYKYLNPAQPTAGEYRPEL